MEGSDIQVTVTRSTTKVVVIALEGPVDGTTDDAANTQLSKAVAALTPPDLVVIDLSTVTFFAAAGVRGLVEVANACPRRNLRVRLVVPPDGVAARVIRIVNLDSIPKYPT